MSTRYFHSLYCNKLLLNNEGEDSYSAFNDFDRHLSEFYFPKGFSWNYTNKLYDFLNIHCIDNFKVLHDFCLPQCYVSFLHVPSNAIYRLYFPEIYKEVYLNANINRYIYVNVPCEGNGFCWIIVFIFKKSVLFLGFLMNAMCVFLFCFALCFSLTL